MVGKELLSFKDENEYIEFLKDDKRADFIWATNSDIQAASNIYDLDINILSVHIKGRTTNEDYARWTKIRPTDVSDDKQPSKVLYMYHVDECHFDLIIEKENK